MSTTSSDHRLLLGFQVLAVAGLISPTTVSAQTAAPAVNSNIEEIVVTARRAEERIQDVPVAISALSGAAITQRGVTNVVDLPSAVPGLFSAPGSSRGNSAPLFGLRGQINREPNMTVDASVGLYFDEVPWARQNGIASNFVDLRSVEVLKGPQGTLFGRNSTAGAILVTPNAPTSEFEGYVKAGIGNFDYFNAEAVVNIPVSDTLAIRFVGSREYRDGYMTDAVGGQKTNDVNNYNARLAIRWSPTDNFTSTTVGSFFDSDTNGEASRLYALAPRTPGGFFAGLFPRFQQALETTRQLGRYEFLSSFNPQTQAVLINGVPQTFLSEQYARNRTYTLHNKSEFRFSDDGPTLRNIASVRWVSSDTTFETVPVPFLAVHASGTADALQYTEELQLQGKTGNLDYIGGVFFFRETGNDTTDQYAVFPNFSINDNRIRNTSYSAFAHFSYEVVDGLSVTAGGRITKDKRYIEYRNRRQTTLGQSASPLYTCGLQPALPVNDGSLCRLPVSVSFTEPTWDVGLNYRVNPDTMVYATVARGYRSGGFVLAASTLAATTPFRPETVLNYEIGLKTDFNLGGMATRLNTAGYYTDYKDLQRTINSAVPGIGIVNTTLNAAKAHIWGAEIDLTLKPSSNLAISLSYAYTGPKYDEFNDTYLEPTNGLTYPVDVSDSTFILTSKHAVSANVAYTLPVDEAVGRPTLSMSYYYRSRFFVTNDINTADCTVPGNPNPNAFYTNCFLNAGHLPGYGLIDLRFDWRNFMGRNVDLGFFVKNLTDNYYFTNGLNALSATGTFAVQVGPPRMFGFEMRVPFGAMAY